VTLDDLERRNSPNRRVISPNTVAFRADYVKVSEIWSCILALKWYRKWCPWMTLSRVMVVILLTELTETRLRVSCDKKCSRLIRVYGIIWFMRTYSRFSRNFFQTDPPPSFFNIPVVRHCVTISATAEL